MVLKMSKITEVSIAVVAVILVVADFWLHLKGIDGDGFDGAVVAIVSVYFGGMMLAHGVTMNSTTTPPTGAESGPASAAAGGSQTPLSDEAATDAAAGPAPTEPVKA